MNNLRNLSPKTNSSEGTFFFFLYTFSQLPNALDKETYDQLKSTPPTAEGHPNLFAWFCLVMKFNDTVKNTWPAVGGAAKPKVEPKKAVEKVEEKVEEKPKADEDEMDLFGDDDEEDSVSIFNSERMLS